MSNARLAQVAIVDYGLGNLYSVKHACEWAGLQPIITASKHELLEAQAIILPGVGAFGDAMENLSQLDLITVLQDIAAMPKLLIGICLGVQLLMSESYEFGRHKGLGIIEGPVVRFHNPMEGERKLKVPQIGWNRICRVQRGGGLLADPWSAGPLAGLADGEFMYFVHSFIAQPQDPQLVMSTSYYGQIEFCSSVRRGNIFACQFHPERSGLPGLRVYQNIKKLIDLDQPSY